eukprot:jgi/Hompol1/3524/HPOL_006675-RA
MTDGTNDSDGYSSTVDNNISNIPSTSTTQTAFLTATPPPAGTPLPSTAATRTPSTPRRDLFNGSNNPKKSAKRSRSSPNKTTPLAAADNELLATAISQLTSTVSSMSARIDSLTAELAELKSNQASSAPSSSSEPATTVASTEKKSASLPDKIDLPSLASLVAEILLPSLRDSLLTFIQPSTVPTFAANSSPVSLPDPTTVAAPPSVSVANGPVYPLKPSRPVSYANVASRPPPSRFAAVIDKMAPDSADAMRILLDKQKEVALARRRAMPLSAPSSQLAPVVIANFPRLPNNLTRQAIKGLKDENGTPLANSRVADIRPIGPSRCLFLVEKDYVPTFVKLISQIDGKHLPGFQPWTAGPHADAAAHQRALKTYITNSVRTICHTQQLRVAAFLRNEL